MKKNSEQASFFDRLKTGLEQSLAYTRGEIALYTTRFPLPAPPMTASRVARIRRRLRMSQALFAGVLNVPIEFVRHWESGHRRPGRAESRLLQIIEVRPGIVREFFGELKDRRLCKCVKPK